MKEKLCISFHITFTTLYKPNGYAGCDTNNKKKNRFTSRIFLENEADICGH